MVVTGPNVVNAGTCRSGRFKGSRCRTVPLAPAISCQNCGLRAPISLTLAEILVGADSGRSSCTGRRTVTNFSAFLGLDVHKDTIAVAIAGGRSSDVRFYGGTSNTPSAVAAMLKKIGQR